MEVNGSSHTFLKHLSKDSFSLADESSILTNYIVSYFSATGLFVESETFIIPSHPIYISRIYVSNIASRDFDSVSMTATENSLFVKHLSIDDQMSLRRD